MHVVDEEKAGISRSPYKYMMIARLYRAELICRGYGIVASDVLFACSTSLPLTHSGLAA